MVNLKSKLAEKVAGDEVILQTGEDAVNEEAKIIHLSNDNNNENEIVPEFAVSIEQAKNRINMLRNFVKEMMAPNIDYGVIPNCNKPSLFKAGAEKLCDIFGFSKEVEILNRVEDWEKGLFHYEVKAILINKRTGLVEAEGIGSCNNRERKYRNQDGYSIINTILKMAKKRALIDAVLSATRSSDIFTQDMEDINANEKAGNTFKEKRELITREQQTKIMMVMAKNRIPKEYAKTLMEEKYKVGESKLLTKKQTDEFIDILKCSSII